MFLVENIQKDNYTELLVYSRDKNDVKHVEKIRDFKPYFYVNSDEIIPDDYRITKRETGHKSLTGQDVTKIYVKRSKDIIGVKDLFQTHHEADVPFTQRYIIDRIGEAEIYKLHIMSLDIETDSKDTFPNIDDPDQAIISCAFADNRGLKRKYIYKCPTSTVDIEMDAYTRVFKKEEQLLEAIIALIHQTDPDVLTGWNVVNFDFAYMINRMRKLEIDYRPMSPLRMVFSKKRQDNDDYDIAIRGRIIIDGLAAYMHFRKMSNQGRAESYSLEFTGQSVLGVGKIPHQENFHDMWVNKPNELLKYNLRDSELVVNILEKLEIIDFFNYIRAKSFAQLGQIYQTTALVDGYLLHKTHNKVVLPSKNKKMADKYGGAVVFPPTPGLYDFVMGLDLKSLYPNIIKTFNVGYETFNPDGEIQLKEGIGFDRGVGIMSSCMRELEVERKVYKKKMWKADKAGLESERKLNHYKQYSVKVLMNSFYGYLGYPGARLYKREVAEAITDWGQQIIKHSKEFLENKGYDVIYGDTDSVYVQAREKAIFKLLKEGRGLKQEINKSYFGFAKEFGSDDCSLEMEFEKIFKKILFVGKKGNGSEIVGAKKKYAYILLWVDGETVDKKVHFTGFETVRSDTPRVARSTQTEIVEMILAGKSKEEVTKYLTILDKDIRTGKTPLEEIAFPKGISKKLEEYGKAVKDEKTGKTRNTGTPPVITGARYANKYLGKRFGQGSKPKWIYIKNVPPGYPDTRILTFDSETLPDGFVVDYDIMIEKILKLKLEEILIASGFGTFPQIDSRIKNEWW